MSGARERSVVRLMVAATLTMVAGAVALVFATSGTPMMAVLVFGAAVAGAGYLLVAGLDESPEEAADSGT